MDKPVRITNQRRDRGQTIGTVIGTLMLVGLGASIVVFGLAVNALACWAEDPWGACNTMDPVGAGVVVGGIAMIAFGIWFAIRRRQR